MPTPPALGGPRESTLKSERQAHLMRPAARESSFLCTLSTHPTLNAPDCGEPLLPTVGRDVHETYRNKPTFHVLPTLFVVVLGTVDKDRAIINTEPNKEQA